MKKNTFLKSEIALSSSVPTPAPSKFKILFNVLWTSNGVVKRWEFSLKLLYASGYLFLNQEGKVNEKNGSRSSSLPCCVLRIPVNLKKNSIENILLKYQSSALKKKMKM